MKYKLINRATNEAHMCDIVTIDGFDYYFNSDYPTTGEYAYDKGEIIKKTIIDNLSNYQQKVIATNNPSIDIPKVIDEVDYLYKNHKQTFIWEPAKEGLFHFKAGYNKSQETHPNSDDDMIEFANWLLYNSEACFNKPKKELLELWKSQQPKALYYEAN